MVEAIVLYLKKLQTIIVDRRAFAALLTLLVALGLVNLTADEVTSLDQQVVDLVVLLSNLLAPLFAGGFLVASWGAREPSGLRKPVDDQYVTHLEDTVKQLEERFVRLERSSREQLLTALTEAGVSIVGDD